MGVCIIAEAGVNHNGSFDFAKKMIDVAAECGVDYIKFQTFKSENLVTSTASKADYQKENTKNDDTQLSMLKKLELSQDDFKELSLYAKEKNIGFISTPFDLESLDFLKTLNMDFWKVPSGEITNYPYLVRIAKSKMPVVMSTGMCELDEIKEALEVLRANGCNEIKLLHCNTMYPTPYDDVNLRAMETLKQEFKVEVGYSDHTQGIEVPIAAVALGATVIEKHFTLDKSMEGPDHAASLDPAELKEMVKSIRNIEKALGTREKTVTESEKSNKAVARKSIVAACNIKKGEVFTEDNLTTKRPGTGISPMEWEKIIGTTSTKDYKKDDLI